jgi:hypothetical protein
MAVRGGGGCGLGGAGDRPRKGMACITGLEAHCVDPWRSHSSLPCRGFPRVVRRVLWGRRLRVATLDLARGWQAEAPAPQWAEDRVESPPQTVENTRNAIRRAFMKFRGRNAHPNRPRKAMACPKGQWGAGAMREAVRRVLCGRRVRVATLDLACGWEAETAGLQGAEDRV